MTDAAPSRRGTPHRQRRVGCAARPRCEGAQASVELALVLPLIVLLFLAGIDVALVARDALHVEHAARQAARVAAVDGDAAAATAAAMAVLGPSSRATVDVVLAPPGGTVSAHVHLVIANHLTMLGRIRPDLSVDATMQLRREGDPDVPP